MQDKVNRLSAQTLQWVATGRAAFCMPAFRSTLIPGHAYLQWLAVWGHSGRCPITLATQEQILLQSFSTTVAQGAFSIPGHPCFLSSPVANSWHLFLGQLSFCTNCPLLVGLV